MPYRTKTRHNTEELLVEDISIEDLLEIEHFAKTKHDELETLEMEILRDYTDEMTLYSNCDSRKCSSAVVHSRFGGGIFPIMPNQFSLTNDDGWWLTFVMLFYMLDAELPSSFYSLLVKTKTFGSAMNDMSPTQRHLIKKFLYLNEGRNISREWSYPIRDIRKKITGR